MKFNKQVTRVVMTVIVLIATVGISVSGFAVPAHAQSMPAVQKVVTTSEAQSGTRTQLALYSDSGFGSHETLADWTGGTPLTGILADVKFTGKYSVRKQNDADTLGKDNVQKADGVYEICYAHSICEFAEWVNVSKVDADTGLTDAGITVTTLNVDSAQAWEGVHGRRNFFGAISTVKNTDNVWDVSFPDLHNSNNNTVHAQRDFLLGVKCVNDTDSAIVCGIVDGSK